MGLMEWGKWWMRSLFECLIGEFDERCINDMGGCVVGF